MPGVLNALIPPPGPSELAAHRWRCYVEANAGIIPLLPEIEYGDATITRIDSCRELHTQEWYAAVSQLWADKDVTLVRGTDRSITPEMLLNSPGSPESVCDILARPKHSFEIVDELFVKIMAAQRETVILCAGPVAKLLVHMLVQRGLYAYDLGHFGVWFNQGLPKLWEECRA